MNLADLGVLYGLAGALSGVVVYRSQPRRDARALGSALLSAPLWPLWLPVLFASQKVERDVQRSGATETEAALLEGHEAVRSTPLEPLLPRAAVDRLLRELRRATETLRRAQQSALEKGLRSRCGRRASGSARTARGLPAHAGLRAPAPRKCAALAEPGGPRPPGLGGAFRADRGAAHAIGVLLATRAPRPEKPVIS